MALVSTSFEAKENLNHFRPFLTVDNDGVGLGPLLEFITECAQATSLPDLLLVIDQFSTGIVRSKSYFMVIFDEKGEIKDLHLNHEPQHLSDLSELSYQELIHIQDTVDARKMKVVECQVLKQVFMPILSQEKVLGVISYVFETPVLKDSDLTFMNFLSTYISTAVARLYDVELMVLENVENERKRIHDFLLDKEAARKELHEALEREERAKKSRDEFLSVASHELKTPITSLKLNLQMNKRRLSSLKDGASHSEFYSQSLDTYSKQVNRIIHFVDQLLDVSKIRKGNLVLKFERAVLTDVIHEALILFKDSLRNSKNTIVLDLDESLEGEWDKNRLEQVFINLLTNAIKYAPGTEIKISSVREDEYARIVVSDKGPGISSSKLELIFEPFERASHDRGISGLGLGLFVAREIVNGLSGEIMASSAPGKGAAFTMILPTSPLH